MKKKCGIVLMVCALALGMTACAGGGGSAGQREEKESSGQPEDQALPVPSYGGGVFADAGSVYSVFI